MADEIPLPKELMHLLEKRSDKDRRAKSTSVKPKVERRAGERRKPRPTKKKK